MLMAVSSAYCVHGQNKLGNFYVTWGYHSDHYTRSNIHFKDNQTDDYNFTLERAKAKDKPDMHDFFHTPLTVPQYSFNLGYFFANKEEWGIEVSWDHLKYVVIDNQTMHLTGDIRGKHFDLDTLVTPGFVHFEHTNGNNYGMVSVVKRFPLFRGKYNRVYRLSLLTKAGVGGLVPKTDSYIMGNHNDGPFRLSVLRAHCVMTSTDSFILKEVLKALLLIILQRKFMKKEEQITLFSLCNIFGLEASIFHYRNKLIACRRSRGSVFCLAKPNNTILLIHTNTNSFPLSFAPHPFINN
jgi:hypothetical protein